MAKTHYATRYKKRIADLEDIIYKYYDAVFEIQDAVRDRNGLKCPPVYCGRDYLGHDSEERMPIKDYEKLCVKIEELPLIDC